jgi:hypothetical protein
MFDMSSELGLKEFFEEFVFGGLKTKLQDRENRKGVRKIREITLNYAASQLDNFDRIPDKILGADDRENITVRTQRKIKHKRRTCDGSSIVGADMKSKRKCTWFRPTNAGPWMTYTRGHSAV